MKPTSCASLALLFVLAACGGKPAQEPENTEESASSGEGGAASSEAPTPALPETPAATGGGKPVGGDDKPKEASPCGGFEINDLLSVISQAACEAPDTKAMSEQKEMKDLAIKVVLDSPLVAPGSTAQVTITYQNKGKADLNLNFVVDPEPRFEFEAYTLKGARADNPPGAAPALPPEVTNAPAPEQKIAKVTLAPLGTAKLTLKWDAVKYKWASKERAKGALPGRGYPREPAGPLKKGKYVLRVVTPLTGVFEGADHEVSQPRTGLTIGGR